MNNLPLISGFLTIAFVNAIFFAEDTCRRNMDVISLEYPANPPQYQ